MKTSLLGVRAEILKIIVLLFGRNDVFIKSFGFLLTFTILIYKIEKQINAQSKYPVLH